MVTIINDDFTLRACFCEIQQQFSETPDGEITHYAVLWYDDEMDAIRKENGTIHIVPVKNVLYERGFSYKPTIVREPEIIPYRMGIREELRNEIYDRDGRKCLFCGSTENLSIDHIHPFSKGGKTELSNLQTLCMTCNRKKKNKVAEEA